MLFKVLLPLFHAIIFLRNLLKELVSLLVLSQHHIPIIDLLFGFVLPHLHVFKFNLAGDQRLPFFAAFVPLGNLNNSPRIRMVHTASLFWSHIVLRWTTLETSLINMTGKDFFMGLHIISNSLIQLVDLLVVELDILTVNQGAKNASCRVGILLRWWLLKHQFL